MAGTIEAIYTAPAEGAALKKATRILAVQGCSLWGDRCCEGTGHWSRFGRVCEVTFIAAEDLEAIERETRVRVKNGEHRRNVVMCGMDPRALRDKGFRVGEALFEYRKYYPFLLFPSRSLCLWLTDIGNTIQATHATVHLRDNS